MMMLRRSKKRETERQRRNTCVGASSVLVQAPEGQERSAGDGVHRVAHVSDLAISENQKHAVAL
jgi:hypothetical protein